jgi:hypothetical protein
MTVTATKIESSHESGKNFITWAWPASTTIIYNNLYNPFTKLPTFLTFRASQNDIINDNLLKFGSVIG